MVNYKKAYTLAEVLITLGIIGVVAAMTLPTLVNNAKNKELHSSLVKAYAAIQTAAQNLYADEGIILTTYESQGFVKKFEPYFKVSRHCNYNCLNSTELTNTYKTYSNEPISPNLLDDGQFFTEDGMFYMINNINDQDILISVDVNGPHKNPNKWGYDLFTFCLMSNGKIIPSGTERKFNTAASCSKNSTNGSNGIGCTFKALYDKDYWKNL